MVVCVVVYLQSETEKHQAGLVFSMLSNFAHIFVLFCFFFIIKIYSLYKKKHKAVHNV